MDVVATSTSPESMPAAASAPPDGERLAEPGAQHGDRLEAGLRGVLAGDVVGAGRRRDHQVEDAPRTVDAHGEAAPRSSWS